MNEEKNMMAEANEETAQTTQSERVIDLGKPYKFEGTEYTSIDLSGLDKLTVKDAIDAQRQLSTSGRWPPPCCARPRPRLQGPSPRRRRSCPSSFSS